MVQQHTDGNRRRRGERIVGKFPRLESLIGWIVEAELARFDQLEHRERIEGLADRRGLETRARVTGRLGCATPYP
jgi:hypothetical protein